MYSQANTRLIEDDDAYLSALYLEAIDICLPTTLPTPSASIIDPSSAHHSSHIINHQTFYQNKGSLFLNRNNATATTSSGVIDSLFLDSTSAQLQRSSSVPLNASFSTAKTATANKETKKTRASNENQIGIDMKEHLQKFYFQVYTCLHRACGLEFVTEESIDNHLKESHKIDISLEPVNNKIKNLSYKCIYQEKTTRSCGRKLETLHSLAYHICKVHLASSKLDGFTSKKTKLPLDFKAILICNDDNCLQAFETTFELKRHKAKVHLKVSQKKPTTTRDKYRCVECDAKFQRPSHLAKHTTRFHNKQWKCELCDQSFTRKNLYLQHKHEVHEKQTIRNTAPAHQCSFCTRSFKSPWLKCQHEKFKHHHNQAPSSSTTTTGKDFKCTFEGCGKQFVTSSKLHRHSLVHLQLKKYMCNVQGCKSVFSRADHLKVHKSNFHSSVKMFKCDFAGCTSTFKYKYNVITHKKTCHPSITKETPIVEEAQDLVNIEEDDDDGPASSTLKSSNNENDLHQQQSHMKPTSHVIDLNEANKKLNDYIMSMNSKKSSNDNFVVTQQHQQQQRFSCDYALSQQPANNLIRRPSAIVLSGADYPTTSTIYFDDNNNVNKSTLVYTENNDDSKDEHIININSDDEEYTASSVVLENLSGSARTDYKSSHMYIERNRLKRLQQRDQQQHLANAKRAKTSKSSLGFSKSTSATAIAPSSLSTAIIRSNSYVLPPSSSSHDLASSSSTTPDRVTKTATRRKMSKSMSVSTCSPPLTTITTTTATTQPESLNAEDFTFVEIDLLNEGPAFL